MEGPFMKFSENFKTPDIPRIQVKIAFFGYRECLDFAQSGRCQRDARHWLYVGYLLASSCSETAKSTPPYCS